MDERDLYPFVIAPRSSRSSASCTTMCTNVFKASATITARQHHAWRSEAESRAHMRMENNLILSAPSVG